MKPTTGLEDVISEILDSYSDEIERISDLKESHQKKIEFCQDHNFKEEERIELVKLNSMKMIFYNWKEMIYKIQTTLNDWNK